MILSRNKKVDEDFTSRIEELKRRRVALWEHARTLPDGSDERIKIENIARNLYDKLVEIGVKII